MIKIECENFSLEQICQSGQCFRMEKLEENKYSVIAFGKYLELSQKENMIIFECTEQEYNDIWKTYFDIDTDYSKIINCVDTKDKYLMAAVAFGSGIRILRQEPWEMIISFIVSQQNNIKRIRKCINLLCEKYGEKKQNEKGVEYFDFPTPQALSQATIEELYECNLGYRSRYIYETSHRASICKQCLWSPRWTL